jgi:hypothetical protein
MAAYGYSISIPTSLVLTHATASNTMTVGTIANKIGAAGAACGTFKRYKKGNQDILRER